VISSEQVFVTYLTERKAKKMKEIICNLEGVKWCIIGDKVLVDSRYLREYRSTLWHKVWPVSRVVAIYALAYVAMSLMVIWHGFYLGYL
jgi:hypothetical protein